MPHADNDRSVALITGAGSGIGAATARLFAEHGYRVALVGSTMHKLENVRQNMHNSGAHLCFEADLVHAERAAEVVDQAVAQFGRLDTLILAAGISMQCPIAEHSAELIEKTFRVNSIAPAHMIVRAWPHFQAHQRGCIVLLSSLASSDPFSGFLAYAASKSALDSFARSVAIEGASIGVTAFALNLGCVETPLLRRLFSTTQVPAEKTTSPESVANVCLECVQGTRDASNGKCILLPSP